MISLFANALTSRAACVLPTFLLFVSCSFAALAQSQANSSTQANNVITDPVELLELVRQQQVAEAQRSELREQRFLAAKDQQQQLLQQAQNEFEQLQRQNNPLKKQTEVSQREIEQLQLRLQEQTEQLGDIASVFKQMSGDFAETLKLSLISAQLPNRQQTLDQLAEQQGVASVQDMTQLWLLLQEELTLSGQIAQFEAPVVAADGAIAEQSVGRIGSFSAYQAGAFLRYLPESQELLALPKQPLATGQTDNERVFTQPELALVTFDPTGGQLLGALSASPDLAERIKQGGSIGQIILGLGAVGVLLLLWRSLYLLWVHQRLAGQLAQPQMPNNNNPLGRVLLNMHNLHQPRDSALASVSNEGEQTRSILKSPAATGQQEVLQMMLEEMLLAEVTRLERGHDLVKLLAAVAPLLGLLGTVTGMILTFQSISLFGSGDPKLMAGGVSQALITTVMGLIVAIPLLFGHSFITSLANRIIQRLDEQSSGVIAGVLEAQAQALEAGQAHNPSQVPANG